MKDIFNKRQRFSIRKFSVGVASVLIGIALFTPSQGVLASTENSPASVEKREAVQPISDNQNNPSSELDTRDVPIGSTRATEPVTSGDKENNSLTTRDFVAGEDRSSTPAVRATSNPSEVKKYELTDEYAKQIKAGVIGSEGNKLDSLLLNGPKLSPEAYTDDDYLKDKEELYIYEKGGKKYVGYNSHPLLEDTDGDGIIDSNEKPDEKLKWNVSERDMIMFMELSYRDDNYIDRVLDHKKPLTESELYKKNGDRKPRYEYMMMNKELGPYWERKKSYHTSSGLDAVLYETKSDFLYLPNGTAQVLAFRGTSDAKDIKADITLGTGGNPQQGIDAENIMRELAKDKSITNLYLTGHSLGGYLVQRAMVEAYQLAYSDSRVMSPKEQSAYRNFYNNVLKKGTTFNAPKVVTSFISGREFWQKGLDSKKIAKSGKLTHYIVDNDSTIRKGVSNDSDVVINVGPTSGGHSSRSYFEADMINRRSEFISGKRISLDGTGYQDKKITTVKSVEKVGETAVYSKRGDDIIKSTTVSMKDPDTGQITKNTLDEVFKKDGVKDKVEVETIPSPVKYEKDASREKGQDNITVPGKDGSKTTTTTYTVNPNSGEAIAHVGEPVIVNPTETIVKVAAKDRVVETPIEAAVVYEKDDTRDFGTPDQRTEGERGKTVTTTTYDVDPKNGHITEHVGKPVVTPAGKTIVKVGAKTKVERSKDDQGREVINTTTYEVDPKTGKVTPTTVTTYGIRKEPTVEKRVVPSPVVYEKDGTKEKGTEAITVKGEEGEDTITTTYKVNPTTGEITPSVGKPVRTKKPTNTIVKVPAKDKVEVRGIPLSKRYVKDASREKGQDNITIPGKDGSRTTTTTYAVNTNNGEVTPNVGEPVIVNPTDTIIKVAAKDKVVYSKDGDNIVKEVTTYTVNPTNGNITENTTKETFKENGLKDKVEVETIPSPVKYEKDASREKGQDNITVPGKDGSKTTTTTYTVNPNNGEVTPNVGEPVIVNPTDTIIKVAAKDKVVYSKDGDNIVKEVTTYTVNPTNGNITENTTKETFKENGLKDKVEVETIPSPVKYEKDASREKGQDNITVPGKDGSKTTTTTYTVNPTNGEAIAHVGEPIIVNPITTLVKVAAKDTVVTSKDGNNIVKTATSYIVNPDNGNIIEHTTKETFKENGLKDKVEVETIPSPVKYEKDASREKGQDNITVPGKDGSKTTTTTYTVNPDNGEVIPNEVNPVIVNPTETIVKVAAKDKVVETLIESEVEYIKDVEKDFGTPDQRTEGEKGKTVTTTTYDVDSNDGHITEHVGNPVVTPAGKTIVKVGAKTKVEQSKDSEGRDVIDTTTYEVDPKTGKVTPTTVRTYGKTKEPTVEKRVVPSPVIYEKDSTKEKGTAPTTVKGEDGEDTITTTYTVDTNTGKIIVSEGNPVRTKEPTNTIVKVAAKDKVVEAPIEPEVEYVRDGEREVDTPNERVEGAKGKTVTTTTYDVDPKDGHITEHVGNPAVTPAGKTIVKVGAKTKVEQSKDSEGRDVIDTTTYEVDPKTGKVTPTTVRTYGKTKEPTVELEQDSKTGDVTVTPKKPDGSTYPPGTTVEIPGKGDEPITVTIGEDGKGKVPNSDLPNVEKTGTGKITEPGKSSVEVPKVTTFENDVLPGSIALPELMIEVRWIDEDENVLKPSVKTGNEKDAEHGSIPGYEFVRTVIDENETVITHIFRKVSSNTNTIPVTPDTNVNSGHDTPDLTTPTPIPVTPVLPDANGNSGYDTPAPTTPTLDSVVQNTNHEETTDVIDNGVKSNDSQNVLPNTGTESNATLASLGLLGMLGGLGLALGKKKED